MEKFNVIIYNYNKQRFEFYDVLPYLIRIYIKYKKDLKTFEEFKDFVNKESMYQWWARCEYEIILSDWPNNKHTEKWDVYKQVLMNLDLITNLLIENLNENSSNK